MLWIFYLGKRLESLVLSITLLVSIANMVTYLREIPIKVAVTNANFNGGGITQEIRPVEKNT
ncbi:hypothetical protein VPHD81_0134 [Vibrio phage D81]